VVRTAALSDLGVPSGDGDTELSDDDRVGLIPSYISTRAELNDAEQRNIADALLRRPPTIEHLLDDRYLRDLHRAMFGDVWRWAGRYRQRETNIGIDPIRITTEVRTLVGDVRAWIDHRTFEADEIGVRFHHRLVVIHPFPNGNGRHSRASADYLAAALGGGPYSWGSGLGVDTQELRARYLAALRSADRDDLSALITFARA